MRATTPLVLISFAAVFTQASAAVVSTSTSPQRACVDLLAGAEDQSEQQASFAIFSRCRNGQYKNNVHEASSGAQEGNCREFVRLYSVARHYSETSGRKLSSEDFCATALGTAVQQGPMEEVDACIAGAEEVLSSTEVSEAAENACRRAHPKEAQAPEACRLYVKSLSEALRRAPHGELVDAEAICGQLVHSSAKQPAAPSGHTGVSQAQEQPLPEETKFVGSCVQFAGNLMSHPGVSEDDVRKSCEAALPSEEKTFCTGYARLVFQRASDEQFTKFCSDEYRKMAMPQAKSTEEKHLAKKASTTAMGMSSLCTHLFEQALSAHLSSNDLKRTANDLCAQELGQLPPKQRPPVARIRVGCRFFASRLASMKEQEGTAANATAFCARIASPPHSKQHAPPLTHPSTATSTDIVKVVATRRSIQRHDATVPPESPQQPLANAIKKALEVAPPTPVQAESAPQTMAADNAPKVAPPTPVQAESAPQTMAATIAPKVAPPTPVQTESAPQTMAATIAPKVAPPTPVQVEPAPQISAATTAPKVAPPTPVQVEAAPQTMAATTAPKVAPPTPVQVESAPQTVLATVAPKVAPLPTLEPNAALPALMAAANVAVPTMPGPEEAAKVKADEDFLGKFLNKYEAKNAVAQAAPAKPTKQPVLKVFREEEMAEVRRKAEQLFGSDVDIVSTGASPLANALPSVPSVAVEAQPAKTVASPPGAIVNQPSASPLAAVAPAQTVTAPQAQAPTVAVTPMAAVATPPVAIPPPVAVTAAAALVTPPVAVPVAQVALAPKAQPAPIVQVTAAPAIAVATPPAVTIAPQVVTPAKVASPAEAGSSKKQTSMLGLDAQVDASSDFLSSFLNEYTGTADTSKLAQLEAASNTVAQQSSAAPEVASSPSLPQPQEQAVSDVDSMVSAFLARN